MGLYKYTLNPITGTLQLVYDGTIATFKAGIDTYSNLPVTGNSKGDARIVNDTGHCYAWSLEATSGDLADWTDLGDIIDVTWAALDGKPSSSVADIDDAVTKKHAHSNKTLLDSYTQTEIDIADAISKEHEHSNKSTLDTYDQTNVNISDAVSKKHEQNKDTKLDEGGSNEVTAAQIKSDIDNAFTSDKVDDFTIEFVNDQLKVVDRIENNIMLLAFYRAVDNSKTIYALDNSFLDEFEDESGIDTVNSVSEDYDSTNDLYRPFNENLKLLLHLNGSDGATTTTDSSPSGHSVTFGGDAQLDTAQQKFGTTSCLFDGADDALKLADHADFDIFASNADNWTVDFFVKHAVAPVGATELYIGQMESTVAFSNAWYLVNFSNSSEIILRVSDGITNKIEIRTPGVYITDTNWHHIALIKIADEYGLYLDGTQIGYTQDSDTQTYAGPLWIGLRGNDAYDFNGWMDEIRIAQQNVFTASPNVGKTDTIVVPTTEAINVHNMTLISEAQVADVAPDTARIVVFEEDVDAITENTDLKAYVSRDDGANYVEATLQDDGNFEGNKRILSAIVDLSGEASDTDIVYKLVTANNKDLKIHGTSLNWA